jgi:primosomal protein N''
MLRQEERATVSLRSFGSLIRVTGRKAKIEETQIDSILNELKQGNFERLAEFEKIVDDLLNNILENIKIYVERDENQKIEMLYQLLLQNFSLFDELDNKDIKQIKSAFDKDLKELIRKLRLEKRNERRLRRGRKPAYTLIKRTFYSKKSLDRQIRRGGGGEINLEHKEGEIEKYIENLFILNKRKGLSEEEKTYVKKAFLELSKVILAQFECLFEVEIDAEIQEADLINEIDEIMKLLKNNPIEVQKLQTIKDNIENHCRTDFYVAKRIFNKNKAVKKGIDQRFDSIIKGKREKLSFSVLLDALRGYEYCYVLFDPDAKKLFELVFSMESNEKPEKRWLLKVWNEHSILTITARIHELMENWKVLHGKIYQGAGGFQKHKEFNDATYNNLAAFYTNKFFDVLKRKYKPEIKEIHDIMFSITNDDQAKEYFNTKFKGNEDFSFLDEDKFLQIIKSIHNKPDNSIITAWVKEQVEYGHPYGLIVEHGALSYLYHKLKTEKDIDLPMSVFLFVNPTRTDMQPKMAFKQFTNDPSGRLKASYNPPFFYSKLLDKEPTIKQIRKGMEFFERCGYEYKHPKSIIKLYKHFGKNNFANMYSAKPWYPYMYQK